MAVTLIDAIIGLQKRDVEEGYREQRIYLWDVLPNIHYMIIKEIKCKKLNIYSLNDFFVEYIHKWSQRLLRMKNTRTPKLVYEYTAAGRRNIGRPKDGGTNTPEALSTYTAWWMMMMMMTTTTTTTTTTVVVVVVVVVVMITVQVYASL
jgi:hypothetical protein